MKQWKVVELDIIIYNYLTHFLSQPQYSMQETFSLAHLQLLHLNNLHKHVKCIFWCQQAFHTISDNMWVGLKIGITIHMLDPVDLCFFQSFHTEPSCKAERFICCIKPRRDIIIKRKSGAGDLKNLFNWASSMLKYFYPG